MSPTMAKKKEQRRQTHEQLANTARKHFNNMGIVENEIVVDFLYKVRWQGEKGPIALHTAANTQQKRIFV